MTFSFPSEAGAASFDGDNDGTWPPTGFAAATGVATPRPASNATRDTPAAPIRAPQKTSEQFVNRSIVNDIFTVDRQQGIQVFGRVLPGTAADFTYYAGVFSGRGVGERSNDDAHMMYAGRLQWNMFGRELDFSQSDVEGEAKPVASFALGASTNISGCTAYETDRQSCRALSTPRSDGTAFAEPMAASGRYKLEQGFAEFRLKWRGLYAKHEYHFKRVIDRDLMQGQAGRTTLMRGSLSQLGYFPHHLINLCPSRSNVRRATRSWIPRAKSPATCKPRSLAS